MLVLSPWQQYLGISPLSEQSAGRSEVTHSMFDLQCWQKHDFIQVHVQKNWTIPLTLIKAAQTAETLDFDAILIIKLFFASELLSVCQLSFLLQLLLILTPVFHFITDFWPGLLPESRWVNSSVIALCSPLARWKSQCLDFYLVVNSFIYICIVVTGHCNVRIKQDTFSKKMHWKYVAIEDGKILR